MTLPPKFLVSLAKRRTSLTHFLSCNKPIILCLTKLYSRDNPRHSRCDESTNLIMRLSQGGHGRVKFRPGLFAQTAISDSWPSSQLSTNEFVPDFHLISLLMKKLSSTETTAVFAIPTLDYLMLHYPSLFHQVDNIFKHAQTWKFGQKSDNYCLVYDHLQSQVFGFQGLVMPNNVIIMYLMLNGFQDLVMLWNCKCCGTYSSTTAEEQRLPTLGTCWLLQWFKLQRISH